MKKLHEEFSSPAIGAVIQHHLALCCSGTGAEDRAAIRHRNTAAARMTKRDRQLLRFFGATLIRVAKD